MPLYHYKCPACDNAVEIFQPTWRDENIVLCRECPDVAMDRIPAPSNFKVEGFNAANGYSGSAKE